MTILFTLLFALLSNPMTSISTDVDANAISIEDGTYSVNLDNSNIEWKAYKVGGQHNGDVDISEGNLEFNNNELTGGTFIIDMKSINVKDLEGEWKQKLQGHLKSPDFFGVENHPKAKFVITDAFPIGTDGKYRIKGDLTIKNITNPISFNAQLDDKGETVVATADLKVDRAKYDVRYGSGSFFDDLGDKTIYDEFDLAVVLEVPKN